MRGIPYRKQLQSLANQYIAEGNPWPIPAMEVARWAIGRGLWQPQPDAFLAKAAEEFARAMGEEFITDPQGRQVRAKHAARFQQTYFWGDIRTADRKFMAVAFQQRRQQIVGDCWQLKQDVDSYNENANPGRPIQLVLDFRADMAEMEALQHRAA